MAASPLLWFALAGWIAAGAAYGLQEIQKGRIWSDAFTKGEMAGKGSAASETVASANETRTAELTAESEMPIVKDKSAAIEQCKRSASCRERRTLK